MKCWTNLFWGWLVWVFKIKLELNHSFGLVTIMVLVYDRKSKTETDNSVINSYVPVTKFEQLLTPGQFF